MDQTKLIEAEIIETPEIHWDHLRKLMEFQELTFPALARLSGTPESTLRKLMQGTTKDPRISTLYPIVRALNASFDRTLGLAPERDFEREEETYDATLMDSMRHQLETMMREREAVSTAGIAANAELLRTLSAKVDEQDKRLDAKRSRLSEQEQEIAVLTERVDAKTITISNLERLCNRRRNLIYTILGFLAIMAALTIASVSYIAWEIINIEDGQTGKYIDKYIESYVEESFQTESSP